MENNLSNVDNKKTELKVKISMLKHNIIETNRELEKLGENQKELNAKYLASKEIDGLRNYQKNTLYDEVMNGRNKNDNLINLCGMLNRERIDLERENKYYSKKIEDANQENTFISNNLEDLRSKKQLLEKEIQLIRERLVSNEKAKMDNDIITSTSQKQLEYLNKELADNNRKTSLLQTKIDDLNSDIKKCQDLLSLENSDNSNIGEFNQTLEKRAITLRESLKINENKIIAIKKEIDNLKEYIEDAQGDRTSLNLKLEELIKIFTSINQTNTKLNTLLSFIFESFSKKTKFVSTENSNMQKVTDLKNKILIQLKEINSYGDIVENY